MEERWLFLYKENFEEVLKYQRDPPCYNCLVRVMCFSSRIDYDDFYEVILSMPCDEAIEWFSGGECMGDFIDAYTWMPEGLIGIKQIRKIIQVGDDKDIDDLARELGVNDSAIEDLEWFVDQLHDLLSWGYEDEIMQGFIIPFVEDQSKM